MNNLIYQDKGFYSIQRASLELLPVNVRVYHYKDYSENRFSLYADCVVKGRGEPWLKENAFHLKADTEIIIDQLVQKYIAPIYRQLVFNAENFTYVKK